jgi:hypothetical protein
MKLRSRQVGMLCPDHWRMVAHMLLLRDYRMLKAIFSVLCPDDS